MRPKLSRGKKEWEISDFHTWSDRKNAKYTKHNIISKSSKVFSIGSCFAEYVNSYLNSKKIESYHFPDTYHFNPVSIEDELKNIFEKQKIKDIDLIESNGYFYNTNRKPSLKFNSRQECITYCNKIVTEAEEKLRNSNVLIITLGGIETWKNLTNNKTCLTIPYPDLFNEKRNLFKFEILEYEQVKKSILSIINMVNKFFPKMTIIFTVSPNMMNFTCSDKDILYSTSQSKSVLRAAIGEIINKNIFKNVYYFHSYELVVYSSKRESYLNHKGHANDIAVNFVMKNFLFYFSHNDLNKYNQEQLIEDESLIENLDFTINFTFKNKLKNKMANLLSFLGLYKISYFFYKKLFR